MFLDLPELYSILLGRHQELLLDMMRRRRPSPYEFLTLILDYPILTIID